MNAIDDTRQIFGAKIEALEARIEGKLAMIFERLKRLDEMPDRAEMHKAIADATEPIRRLIIWTAFGATGTILSLMIALCALNIDVLSNGFDIAQMIVERDQARDKKYAEELRERDKKHDEDMLALRNMIIDNGNFLRKLRDELLQKQAPQRP
jgi:hypothetical protein